MALAATLLCAASAAQAGTLTVRITNVRNARGDVHVDACPEALFLKDDCPYAAAVPAHEGTTTVTLRGLPAGTYAIQAFHDENMNHRVDRALFGIPKEGVGFSNDAPIHLGPPKWQDAAFDFDGGDQQITLKMRYMIGPSGPGKH